MKQRSGLVQLCGFHLIRLFLYVKFVQIPLQNLPCSLSTSVTGTEAAPLLRLLNQPHNSERSALRGKFLLLCHSWWFCLSGQTLTEKNGYLLVLLVVNLEFSKISVPS